jgi:hypothetical protein
MCIKPNQGERFTTAYIPFQPPETCSLAPVSPSRAGGVKNTSWLKYSNVFFNIISFGSGLRVLKPFKQSVGFQEKHAVAPLPEIE